jgi:hypothetical protein
MPFIQFQHRRDTPLNWFTANTILAAGEMGLEVGNDLFKIGDGIRPWNSLPYGGLRGVTGATGGGVDLSTLNPIAIGVGAGATGQVINAIAIGPYAGATGQKNSAIAIGIAAGQINQGNNAIAIGASAGYTGQAANTIILNASGAAVNGVSGQAGSFYVAPVRPSTSSYVLGYDPSTFEITYAIPAASGATGATATVSVGTVTTLAPGSAATVTDVGTSYASILNFGIPQGATGGGTGGITFSGPSGSVLYYDGTSVTGSSFFTFNGTTGATGEVTIAGKLTVLGGIDPLYLQLVPTSVNPLPGVTGTLWVDTAGKLNYDNILVGGTDLTTLDPIAIGVSAGEAGQSSSAVAIGFQAGQTSQGGAAVAIGNQAGQKTQGMDAIAIGNLAGYTGQQGLAIAIGRNAGQDFQQNASIAIGAGAGNGYQQQEAISIGIQAGNTGQQQGAIAIGYLAGNDTQNTNAVAIGTLAGASNQAANTIILNATGSDLNGVSGQVGSFYVAPVRSATSSNVLGYDPVTSEITYYAAPVGATGDPPTAICATARSTASQGFTAGVSDNIQHDAVDFEYGITVTTGATGYFEVPSAGVYKIIPSLQLNPENNGHIHVWLKVNEAHADNTGAYLAFKSGDYQVFTTEILLELQANDQVQVWAQPSVTGSIIQYIPPGGTAPNDYPAAPGIVTKMYKLRDASAPV